MTANWIKNQYIITLDANGGTGVESSQTVTYDESYTLPIPTRTGYTFDGWFCGTTPYSGGTWLTPENIILVAKWKAKTDISYVVNHYQQNVNDDNYTLESSEYFKGTADANVTPSVKTFNHFVSPITKTVKITPDGSLIVDYYYNRATYDLTYVTNGGDTIEKQTYKYGQVFVVSEPTRTGYTFGGWFTEETLETEYSATATLNENTMIYAYWEEENKPGDFTYSGTSAIIVNSYIGSKKNVIIPAYIGGIPVTSIKDYAFSSKTTIISMIMPDTITTIGKGAFYNCSSMISLRLSYNLQSISDSMCYECTSLTEIDIPDSVTKIYNDAFMGCTVLNKVILGKGVTDIYFGAFLNCNNVEGVYITDLEAFCKINYSHNAAIGCTSICFGAKLYVNGELLTDLVIPESITEVKDWFGFSGYTALKSVTFHDKVTSIGSDTFDG